MKWFFEIINYKKIKNLRGELSSGNLYFISGSNMQGKTSFIRAIATLLNAQNNNVNPITFGEDKCVISSEINFTGADKEKYIVKFEIDDKKERFMMVSPDGKATTSVKEIRDIFKFNDFSVDDWFAWGLTSEGRKKQAKVIRSLFPDSVNEEIDLIDKKIDPKKGLVYKRRTEINSALKISNTKISQSKISLEDEKNIAIYDSKKKEIDILREEINKITNVELLNELSTITTKGQIILQKKKAAEETYEIFKANIEDTNRNLLKQMEELQRKIDNNNLYVVTEKAKLDSSIIELGKELTILKERKDEIKANIPVDADIKTAEYKDKLELAEASIQNIPYNDLQYRKRSYEEEEKNYKQLENDSIKIQKEMDDLIAKKKQLFSSTKLPLDNICIVDDECMFIDTNDNILPFTEEHVSYSQGGIPIAEMLMEINKTTRIVMLGKASEYDNESIDKLYEIAKKYNGIIIADKVLTNDEPLKLEVFETLNNK